MHHLHHPAEDDKKPWKCFKLIQLRWAVMNQGMFSVFVFLFSNGETRDAFTENILWNQKHDFSKSGLTVLVFPLLWSCIWTHKISLLYSTTHSLQTLTLLNRTKAGAVMKPVRRTRRPPHAFVSCRSCVLPSRLRRSCIRSCWTRVASCSRWPPRVQTATWSRTSPTSRTSGKPCKGRSLRERYVSESCS